MNLALYRKRMDWLLLLPAALLLLIGIASVYSATHLGTGGTAPHFERHIVYVGLGIGVFLFFLMIPLRLWEDAAYLVWAFSLILLVLVLAFGLEMFGARRWFAVGPFKFQPSEFAKLALICVLARYLASKRVDMKRASSILGAAGLILLPMILVLKQPDLGTSAAFPALALPMLLWAGISWSFVLVAVSPVIGILLLPYLALSLVFILGSGIALWRARLPLWLVGIYVVLHLGLHWGAPLAIGSLHPYQQDRIETFFDPGSDPSGTGWHVLQSRIALGSGQAFGKGYMQGSQKALAFLPMQHNDFIFATIGEEWGFAGCALVVILFATLVLRAFHVAAASRSSFGSLLIVGVAGLVLYHASVNMAMTMGLFPVTGLPLPFVSYGGSFLLTMMAGLGQMANVAVHRYDH